VKLGHVQNPEEIAGCVKLAPDDDLSQCFSSPPRKHIHIIVHLPPNREYSRHLFILPICLNYDPSFLRCHPYVSPMFHAVSLPYSSLLFFPPQCFFRSYPRCLDKLSNEGKQLFQLHTLTNSLPQMSVQRSEGVQVKKLKKVCAFEIRGLWGFALTY
jgi:hypothetical protein